MIEQNKNFDVGLKSVSPIMTHLLISHRKNAVRHLKIYSST